MQPGPSKKIRVSKGRRKAGGEEKKRKHTHIHKMSVITVKQWQFKHEQMVISWDLISKNYEQSGFDPQEQ